jgi:hypothetical protein
VLVLNLFFNVPLRAQAPDTVLISGERAGLNPRHVVQAEFLPSQVGNPRWYPDPVWKRWDPVILDTVGPRASLDAAKTETPVPAGGRIPVVQLQTNKMEDKRKHKTERRVNSK